MRLIRINEAEAIIEPFWTGDAAADGSAHSPLDEYNIIVSPNGSAKILPYGAVTIEQAAAHSVALSLQRECDVDLRGYDTFRIFASLASELRMRVHGSIDNQSTLLLDVVGNDTCKEFDAPLQGRHLAGLRLEFLAAGALPVSAVLNWIGLANAERQREMEARPSPYDAQWRGLLQDAPPEMQPHAKHFFSKDELRRLREQAAHEPLASALQVLRAQCEKDLALVPEDEIGEFVAAPNRRFCRDRDMQRRCFIGVMERLAFVGLIDNDARFSAHAARMALSVAHCEHWCESVMGVFPGSQWHHRSFLEALLCSSCDCVLDWAGDVLTPAGRETIRDAIAMKGLPRIESDFMRWGYIRAMNQGLMFGAGRVLGLLAMATAYSRYHTRVDEAEHELHEMIAGYFHEDGGTSEGLHYGAEVVQLVTPPLWALARRRNQPIREYLQRHGLHGFVKAGDFALSQISSVGNQDTFLPIGASCGDRVTPQLAANFALLTGTAKWRERNERQLRVGKCGGVWHWLFSALAEDGPASAATECAVVHSFFPTGFASIRRKATAQDLEKLGTIHFCLQCGASGGGHSHEDKGSFILEAAGEALAIDRGVADYADPRHRVMSHAAYHNLLCPEEIGVALHQVRSETGSVLLKVEEKNGGDVLLTCDNVLAWEEGLFRRNERRVYSPRADVFLIEDDVELSRALAMSFRINAVHPLVEQGDTYLVRGDRASLHIQPLNWTPDKATITTEGIDYAARPVHLLRLVSKATTRHCLQTLLQVASTGMQPAPLEDLKFVRKSLCS